MLTSIGMSTSALGNFATYKQLCVDRNGETSMVEREFKDIASVGYSNVPQLVCHLAQPFQTKGVVFTRMSGENPWHHPPSPQIVVTLGGSWYIRTTDGVETQLPVGTVLFQDNIAAHPAAEPGTTKAQHFSGSVGPTCDQMIVTLESSPIPDSKTMPGPL